MRIAEKAFKVTGGTGQGHAVTAIGNHVNLTADEPMKGFEPKLTHKYLLESRQETDEVSRSRGQRSR